MTESSSMPIPKIIVVLLLDALRFDAVGYEPDKRYWESRGLAHHIKTPNLDALAELSGRYHSAITPAPYTTAAHASLFTGLYPPRHGIRSFFNSVLNSNAVTLAEIMKEQGFSVTFSVDYRAAFVFNGLDRGVDRMCWSKKSTVRQTIFDFVRDNRDKGHFIFIHTADTHQPYGHSYDPLEDDYNQEYKDWLLGLYSKYGLTPKRYQVKPSEEIVWWFNDLKRVLLRRGLFLQEILPAYLRGVEKTDGSKVKHILDFFLNSEMARETCLIVTSDHGEGEYQTPLAHTNFDHGEVLSEGLIRVPLLIHYPQLGVEGHSIYDQVSLVDIFPTVVELAGVSTKDRLSYSLDGQSLVPALVGNSLPEKSCYSEVWKYNWDDVESQINKTATKTGEIEEEAYTTILFARSVRTIEEKYVEKGDHLPENIHEYEAKKMIETAYRNILAILHPPQVLIKATMLGLYAVFFFEVIMTPLRKCLPNRLRRGLLLEGNSRFCLEDIVVSAKRKFMELFFHDGKRKRYFYNVKDDPLEKNNLMSRKLKSSALITRMEEELWRISNTPQVEAEKIKFKSKDEREETIEALKALGYF